MTETRLGRNLDDLLPARSTRGQCKGKVLYESHAQVSRMGKFLRRQGVRGLTAYRCKLCKAWHLGNAPQTKGNV